MTERISYYFFTLILGLIFLLSSNSTLFGQKKCATTFHEHPSETKTQFEEWMRSRLSEKKLPQILEKATQGEQETLYTIPIVIHIVHAGEALGVDGNIPLEQIMSQLLILNEDYRRLNADTVDTPLEFQPVAADIEIEFIMAQRDPNGQPTDGIVRVQGNQDEWNALSFADDEELKSMSYWPAEDYLNIWVTALESNFLGYATFPITTLPGINEPETNRLLDGIVVDYRFFGEGFNALAFSKGRTATHEIGHFLGLRHMDGDPVFGQDGCLVDDFVDDTPLTEDQASGCPTGKITCGSTDMIENYMDFTNDVCMNIFTEEQKGRMRTVMDNSPRRNSLLTSPGLIPPVLDFDLGIASISTPGLIECETTLTPSINVQNFGTMPISGYDVSYQIDGGSMITANISDNFDPGTVQVINFAQITLSEGLHDIRVSISNVAEGDLNPNNDVITEPSYITIDSDLIPIREEFKSDNLENGWFVLNFDNNLTWELVDAGNPGFAAKMNHYNNVFVGEENWLVSPLLDLSQTTEASLSFEVSYAQNGSRNDGLKVLVFPDGCDSESFNSVFQKFGGDLAVSNSIISWTPDDPGDWRREIVDLSQFAGSENVRIAFVAVNGFGNNLYLDNIELFTSDGSNLIETPLRTIKLFPNPAINELNVVINLEEKEEITLDVIDPVGHTLSSVKLPNSLNQTYTYDMSTLPAGVYLIRARGKFINKTERVIKYR